MYLQEPRPFGRSFYCLIDCLRVVGFSIVCHGAKGKDTDNG